MNDYIIRKTETYTRAQQSLGRVLKAYGQTSSRWSGASSQVTSRTDLQWQRSTTSATPSVPEEEEVGENDESQNVIEPEENDPWARSSQSHGTQQGWQSSHGAWDQWWGDDADWTTEAPEILPDMIQGWYLLGDSGLDTGERNMILAAIKQDFGFDRVAQELRNQWPDDDLRRRDQNNRQSGWWMDEADSGEDDNAFIAMDDLNEEGQALVVAAQEEVDRALMAMQNGRRTLREAREKQHQVRMSRKYYKTTFRSGNKGSGKGHDHKGTGTCLRCGGDHRTANCPKSTSTAATASEEHTAPFVCFAEDDIPEYAQSNMVEDTSTGSEYILFLSVPVAGRCRPVPAGAGPYVWRCTRWPAGAGCRPVPVAGRCRLPAGAGGRPLPAGAGLPGLYTTWPARAGCWQVPVGKVK